MAESAFVERGRLLAGTHRQVRQRRGEDLREILSLAQQSLNRFALAGTSAPDPGERAAQTQLLDRCLFQANMDIRPGYSAGLPRVRTGDGSYRLRVHDIARAFMAFAGDAVNARAILDFVAGYQQVSVLLIAELNLVGAMLRIVILESSMSSAPPLPLMHFVQSNIWREFVSTAMLSNPCESILRSEKCGVYAATDIDSRQRYWDAVDQLAHRCNTSAAHVARVAVSLADSVGMHVGHHLFSSGRSQLEQALAGQQPTLREALIHAIQRRAGAIFLAGYGGLIVLAVAVVMAHAHAAGVQGLLLCALAPTLALAFSQAVLSVLSYVLTLTTQPARLPRLDFSSGVPDNARTAVVMPVKASRSAQVLALCERLEKHYLLNRDLNIVYCLLLDFADALTQQLPTDEPMLESARQAIAMLNDKHQSDGRGPFLLLYRDREWNPAEGVWMGWERKRGKLIMLNRCILGTDARAMRCEAGQPQHLRGVRYVITLDADNSLPAGSARRLIGTLAHPLNQARFDAGSHKVVEGYTILQPAIVPERQRDYDSHYRAAFDPGLDQLCDSFLFRNINQDLFREGEYWGKGIYDVQTFQRTSARCIPENRVSMHDLVEGMFGRTGFVGDVRVGEIESNNVLADMGRLRRWARGDWQNIFWMGPRVPWVADGGSATQRRTPLALISRWKLFNHLQMTLSTVAQFALLIGGMTLLGNTVYWTGLVALILFVNLLSSDLMKLGTATAELSLYQHLQSKLRLCLSLSVRVFSIILVTPTFASIYLHAIAQALWRTLVSRKRLLEWAPYGDVQLGSGLRAYLRLMWAGPVASLFIGTAIVATTMPSAPAIAALLLALWCSSPLVSWLASRPRKTAAQGSGSVQAPRHGSALN